MGAGLDTRGVVDGFAKGFGLVDRYYDKEEDRSRRDRLDQEQADYRQQRLNAERESREAAQDRWQQTFDANQERHKQQQTNWQASHDLSVQQNAQAESHRSWSRGRTAEQDKIAASNRQHELDMEYITQAYNAASQGVPFDEQFFKVVSQPRYANLDPRRLLSEEMGEAINQGKRVMNPNDPADLNDPATLASIGYLLDHDINSDREGNPLEGRRRLVGLYPGSKEGTLVGEVEMEDGRRVPMTENRGTEKEGDNTLLQQPAEGMIHKLASADAMRQFLQSDKGRAALVNMGRAHGLIAKPQNKLDPRVKAQLDINKAKLQQLYKALNDEMIGEEQSVAIQQQIAQIDASNHQLLYGKSKPAPDLKSARRPPAAEHKGRTIRDTETGKRYTSNGTDWVAVK